jgi:4-amino-4-deoxy-L-arabinose transferase-like glycosyltransferase
MTSLGDILLAILFAGILNQVILSRIRARSSGEEQRFLVRTYAWTLLLRWAMAIFLNRYADSVGMATLFWGDSSTYEAGGYLLASAWRGDSGFDPASFHGASGWGFLYFVGAVYYVFGPNALLVQFFNATLGSLTVLLVYDMTKRLFGEAPARHATRMMAFFPGMVFWSRAIYKDPAVLLCIALCMRSVLQLRERPAARPVVVFVLASLALMTLRFYVFYMVVFAAVGTLAFSYRRGFARGLAVQILLAGVFAAAFSLLVGRATVEEHFSFATLERLQITRLDLAQRAGSGFMEEADVSTQEGILSALPRGLLYLLFAPFPWSLGSFRQMLALPETLVWYALMPALLRGLLHTIRHRLRDALPILAFAVTLTVFYAAFQGNVGTAYRQRTQVTMFLYMLIGVGLVERRRARSSAPLPVPAVGVAR